ncbi:MAG: hypothetical protein N2F24_02895 [Deltaproteobacteria bacterium]
MIPCKRGIIVSAIAFIIGLSLVMPVVAEDIEETIKYKAPTMQQTTDFIDKMTMHTFGFDPGQCMVTTKTAKNTVTFTYHIPLKKINPSPDYVMPSLNCVTLTVDGYEKEIKRVESNGDVEMKSKADICAADRESAEKLAKAMRYLIGLCGGPSCEDCDPFQWQ